jgi:hypothetical protein
MTEAALYSEGVAQINLWRGESGIAYKSFYVTRLAYGTPETSLTYNECEEIHKPVVNVIIPKMGVSTGMRHEPRHL